MDLSALLIVLGPVLGQSEGTAVKVPQMPLPVIITLPSAPKAPGSWTVIQGLLRSPHCNVAVLSRVPTRFRIHADEMFN